MTGEPTLRRALSLPLLVLYGLGTTIGAGIYALTGEIARGAGMWAPISFLLAALLATFTALSFAELSSRFPRSAGEAVYVREGLGWPGASLGVGLLVVLAGTVSAATVTVAFVGYLAELVAVPAPLAVLLLACVLGAVASSGVGLSVGLAAVITVIELGGLLLVIGTAAGELGSVPARLPELMPPFSLTAWTSIAAGALLAFYAFLGFEDMVNVAEEVRDVRRVLPRAIVITLIVTALLYAVLSLLAVIVVPPAELGQSDAPLTLVYERAGGRAPQVLSAIGVIAMVNGALIQVIMASRVLYGLASQGSLPRVLGRIQARSRTPVLATLVVVILLALLALSLPLRPLAEITSVLTIVVFALVNLSLLRIKRRVPNAEGATLIPSAVPVIGLCICLAFLLFELVHRLGGLV